jgi:hypothetical protein
MSALKITLEITSIDQINALKRALQSFDDCSSDMQREEADQIAKGEITDWRDIRDNKELKRHITACQELLKAIGAS